MAEELVAVMGADIKALVGSVGSGGSLCGTARALRSSLFNQPGGCRAATATTLCRANIDYSVIDEVHWLNDGEAFGGCRELARREGVFAGGSSGSVYVVASWVAEQLGEKGQVVVILPDRGDRYAETIFSDSFLAEHGLLGCSAAWDPVSIRYGVDVAEQWSRAELPHDGSQPYHTDAAPRTCELAQSLGALVGALTR